MSLSPPFRLRAALGANSLAGNEPDLRLRLVCQDPGCEAGPPGGTRRRRLGELDAYLLCSLIGTCLDDTTLRRIVPRHKAIDRKHASELEVHHAAVELAGERGEGAKALHKALDERYAGAVARWRGCSDGEALMTAWADALDSGDVAPTYWVLMTHPSADEAMRARAFGDVHMLSHRIGSANRADMRRLTALERENHELRGRLSRQAQRLQEACAERDAARDEARAASSLRAASDAALRLAVASSAAPGSADGRGESVIARLADRRDAAERAVAAALADKDRLEAELAKSHSTTSALYGELAALEAAVRDRAELGAGRDPSPWQGRRVLYVGGRPSSNGVIRRLAVASGIEPTCHDGGIEDRKGLLPAAVAHADLVLFPVVCVDHDSMTRLKRLCARHDVPWRALRSAGVASVLAALRAPMQPSTDASCLHRR